MNAPIDLDTESVADMNPNELRDEWRAREHKRQRQGLATVHSLGVRCKLSNRGVISWTVDGRTVQVFRSCGRLVWQASDSPRSGSKTSAKVRLSSWADIIRLVEMLLEREPMLPRVAAWEQN